MSDKKRLFLVDAYALIFRGYFALIKNPRLNSKGQNTSAIFGFMNSLLDVVKRERPDHLAVCFDKGGSEARNEMFPEYKANRDETPDAIRFAIPYICDILEAMKIPIMAKEGFEADDVIGTLAKKAEKQGYSTFMVTPDKDFAQLVSENIFMYRPVFGGGYETWGIPEVKKKFEVKDPLQVIDFLGMMGDSSDNIPGLPGVQLLNSALARPRSSVVYALGRALAKQGSFADPIALAPLYVRLPEAEEVWLAKQS